MTITWVLIANSGYAKLLYAHNDAREIRLIKEFLHPEMEKKRFDDSVDVIEEFHRTAPVKPAMDYAPKVHDYHRLVFAKELEAFLEKAHDLGDFNRLIIVAPKEMIGDLRKAMVKSLKNVVEYELGKDLLSMNLSNTELLAKIQNDLGLERF